MITTLKCTKVNSRVIRDSEVSSVLEIAVYNKDAKIGTINLVMLDSESTIAAENLGELIRETE